MLAVEHDQLPVATYLLERGLDPNKLSARHNSPLNAAARLPVRDNGPSKSLPCLSES